MNIAKKIMLEASEKELESNASVALTIRIPCHRSVELTRVCKKLKVSKNWLVLKLIYLYLEEYFQSEKEWVK